MGFYNRSWSRFPKTMTVDERRSKAARAAEKLGRKQNLDPIVIDGPLAVTWWGKAWNQNLESYADYSNRLPRGRSYARHGSVIDLRIEPGSVSALVQGSQTRPYEVKISIAAMDANARAWLIEACAGKLDSTEALLSGRFPENMMQLLTAEKTGLFPRPSGIRFSCSCPDSASLCKHIAAALYGVGARLDRDATHFFRLRKIELEELVSHAVQGETQRLLEAKGSGESVRMPGADGELSALFGIDISSSADPGVGTAPVIQPLPRNLPDHLPEHRTDLLRRKKSTARKPARDLKIKATAQDALKILDALDDEITRLESLLNSFLKANR